MVLQERHRRKRKDPSRRRRHFRIKEKSDDRLGQHLDTWDDSLILAMDTSVQEEIADQVSKEGRQHVSRRMSQLDLDFVVEEVLPGVYLRLDLEQGMGPVHACSVPEPKS